MSLERIGYVSEFLSWETMANIMIRHSSCLSPADALDLPHEIQPRTELTLKLQASGSSTPILFCAVCEAEIFRL